MKSRVRKGRTILSDEQARLETQGIVDDFNSRHPVGSKVWYWISLPFGPVQETTIRELAFVVRAGDSNAGEIMVFLAKKAGYVSIWHVAEVDESRRREVNPEVLA